MKVLEINSTSFQEEVLSSEKPVFIDFFATWCGPCQMQSPILDEIAQNREDIKVVKVDVDKNADLAEKYEIMSIPTIIIMKNGQVINKYVGLTSKEELLNSI